MVAKEEEEAGMLETALTSELHPESRGDGQCSEGESGVASTGEDGEGMEEVAEGGGRR